MLIGINGVAGSGKDTFSKYLSEVSSLKTYALGGPPKKAVCELFGWDERAYDGTLKEEKIFTRVCSRADVATVIHKTMSCYQVSLEDIEKFYEIFDSYCIFDTLGFMQWEISPREAYQLFGTEFGREVFSDTIWTSLAPTDNCIITDVRIENEAEFIKDNDGVIIQIIGSKRPTKNSDHLSERGIDKSFIDKIIKNDSTKTKLKGEATKLWKELTGNKE